MGLNASAAFNFLDLKNNNSHYKTFDGNGNSSSQAPSQQEFQTLGEALKNNDDTYNMPSGSIYDTAGSVAYNYYNTSFSTGSSAETAGSIASNAGAETAGSIASSSGGASFASSSGSGSSSGGSSPSGGSTTAGTVA